MKTWLTDTFVRTIKTFAQSLVGVLGAGQAGIVHTSFGADLSIASFAAVVCVLHNIQSIPLGSKLDVVDEPALATTKPAVPAPPA